MQQRISYRLLRATVLATLATLLFATHVFVSIDRVRVKVLQAPARSDAGVVRATTARLPRARELWPPFALIARISNASRGTGAFDIAVDGAPVCTRDVASGGSQRVDCAVLGHWNDTGDHDVTIKGPPGAWTLDYLNLATHHGNTSGLHYVVVLPRGSDRYERPALAWVIAAWLALVSAITFLPVPPTMPRWARGSYGIVAGAIVVELVLSLSSQWISDYRIVISAGTFTLWLLLLLAPRLWIGGSLLAHAGARYVEVPGARRAVALVVVLAVCLTGVAAWALLLKEKGDRVLLDGQQVQLREAQVKERQAQIDAREEQLRTGQERLNAQQQQLRSAQSQINAQLDQLRTERDQLRIAQARYDLFAELQPARLANCTFERFGEPNDGGYLLCANLLASVRSAYSYGISGYDQWGCDVSRRLVVPVHEYDCFDATRPLCPEGRPVFHDECVAGETARIEGRPFDTPENQLAKNGDAGKHLVVKIDVEGAEWDTLLRTPDAILDRIDQLAIELHGVDQPERFLGVVRKLKRFFYVANMHFNNFSCARGIAPFPAWAYEVLFVSKHLGVLGGSGPAGAPPGLTTPNNPASADCQSLSDTSPAPPPAR
jgi:hypothetical protein